MPRYEPGRALHILNARHWLEGCATVTESRRRDRRLHKDAGDGRCGTPVCCRPTSIQRRRVCGDDVLKGGSRLPVCVGRSYANVLISYVVRCAEICQFQLKCP